MQLIFPPVAVTMRLFGAFRWATFNPSLVSMVGPATHRVAPVSGNTLIEILECDSSAVGVSITSISLLVSTLTLMEAINALAQSVVLADRHTFPKCPRLPQRLHVFLKAGHLLDLSDDPC